MTYLTNNEDKNNKDMRGHPKKNKNTRGCSQKNKKKTAGGYGGVPPVLFDPINDVKPMPQTHTPIMRRAVGVQCDVWVETP